MPTLRCYRISGDNEGRSVRVEVAPPPPGVRLAERQEQQPLPPLPQKKMSSSSSVPPLSSSESTTRRNAPPVHKESNQARSNVLLNGGGRCDGIKNPTGNKFIAQWNLRYGELIEYKQRQGHCLVSREYDKSNKQLGTWADTQRSQYRLFKEGKKSAMTTERIDKLEEIGFVWDVSHVAWHHKYCELVKFKKLHGHCIVPRDCERNKQLGWWVDRQRKQYRLLQQGKESSMTPGRIAKLEEIGFVWDGSHEAWHHQYGELVEFKKVQGHCNVPRGYEPNKQLGNWVMHQRQQYRLLQQGKASYMTEERIAKLEEIGFVWNVVLLSNNQSGNDGWSWRDKEGLTFVM